MSKHESVRNRFGIEGPVDTVPSREAPAESAHVHGDGTNDHLASIYDGEHDQFETVVPFIRRGLERGERCLYVADDNTKTTVREALRDGGIDVEATIESGALSIYTKADTYVRRGEFDGEAMGAFWEDALAEARDEEGYSGVRAAAEMTWALEEETGLDRLAQYEAMLNSIYHGDDYVVLCQYNRERFSPEVLSDVIRTHPYVVYNATACRNYYYHPPEEFLEADYPSLDPDRVVEGLLDRARTGQSLRDRERGLTQLTAVTQDLLGARPGEVSELVTEAAQDILEPCVSVVWRYDEVADDLHLDAVRAADTATGRTLAAQCKPVARQALVANEVHVSNTLDDQTETDESEPSLQSGVFVPLDGHGVFVAGATEAAAFEKVDIDVARTLATNAEAALDRADRERRLERHRERLGALNNLNEVVQEITHAVIDSSTRAEIESLVCDRLAATESYLFAWIGDVEWGDGEVRLRTGAHVDGYLEDFTITLDSESPGGDPTGRAVETQTVQVARNVLTTADHEPWRDHAREYGIRSAAAIPIVHEGAIYGALAIYADRPDAFDDDERRIVGRLGEIIGHAIAAIDRKTALMSDDAIELEFHVENILDSYGLSEPLEGTITYDRVIPAGDGTFLQYGTATGNALETMEALVEQAPHCEGLTVVNDADVPRFELRCTEPPLFSAIASLGGRLDRATIEDGHSRLVLQVPNDTDVQQVIGAVRDEYPGADLVAKRHRSPQDRMPGQLQDAVTEDLTDRQRAVLEAHYFAGYFDWPRVSTGEDVAEALGITPATASQHLRAGERKLLQALFEGRADSA